MPYRRKYGIVFSLPTLISRTYGQGFPDITEDVRFYPSVRPILRRLSREGYFLFLLCNTPEVYTGDLTLEEVYQFLHDFQNNQLPEDVRFSNIYYESDPRNIRFMPCSGMVKELITDFSFSRHDVLMVGRSKKDLACSESARVDYYCAEEFFSTLVPKRV